jgi:hypothetical protein
MYCARSPFKWPGTATLEVISTSLTKVWSGDYRLDDKSVEGITEELTPGAPSESSPYGLSIGGCLGALGIKLCPANREISYQNYLRELSLEPELKDFFVPAIGGDELYDLVDLNLAARAVAPEKLAVFLQRGGELKGKGTITILEPSAYYHSRPAAAIMRVLERSRYAFACGETSTVLRFTRVPAEGCILKHKLIVFPANDWGLLAILQSDIHSIWAWRWELRRESRIVYSPKRCAATFPLPSGLDALNSLAERYYRYRQSVMRAQKEGLTKTYTRFHDPREGRSDILELRALHVEMNRAVAATYGWDDGFDLGDGFHETPQGLRFTISENARRSVLGSLMALNHQRHIEAEADQLTFSVQPKPGTKRGLRQKDDGGVATPELFD